MPHQLLLHFHRISGLVQPRTIRVRNVCQPISPSFHSATLRVSWIRARLPCAVGAPGQHHTLAAAPHVGHATTQHPEGRRCRFWISVGWYVRFVIGLSKPHPSAEIAQLLLQKSWDNAGVKSNRPGELTSLFGNRRCKHAIGFYHRTISEGRFMRLDAGGLLLPCAFMLLLFCGA